MHGLPEAAHERRERTGERAGQGLEVDVRPVGRTAGHERERLADEPRLSGPTAEEAAEGREAATVKELERGDDPDAPGQVWPAVRKVAGSPRMRRFSSGPSAST